jgi:hypothetical protein
MVFGLIKFLITERFLRLVGQGCPQLVVAHTAAVLWNQSEQSIGEVSANGHGSGQGQQMRSNVLRKQIRATHFVRRTKRITVAAGVGVHLGLPSTGGCDLGGG